MIAEYFASVSLFQAGLIASTIAALATGLGALPVFIVHSASARVQDVLLGVAAGLMLGATAFSLVVPALEAADPNGDAPLTGAAEVGLAMMLGGVLLWMAHRVLPHEHMVKGPEGGAEQSRIRGIWLFVIAITVHNFPEGLAVGVGFGGGDVANGLTLMTAIFLQNLPEGFAVALAMLTLGYATGPATLIALGTGLVETVGGLVGAGVVSISTLLLPSALAFAGGAMLFVISHEVIPETHRNGHETPATFGLMAGFVMMMILDVAIG